MMNEEPEASPQRKEPLPPEGGKKSRRRKKVQRYPYEVELKAVKLYLDEEYSGRLVAQELGVSQQSLSGWVRDYRALGESGLKPSAGPRGPGRSQLPSPVTERILQLKGENPAFGVKRIAQWMRRFFMMEASPESVRQKLHAAGLLEEARPRRSRNLTRPRFFERLHPDKGILQGFENIILKIRDVLLWFKFPPFGISNNFFRHKSSIEIQCWLFRRSGRA